MYTNKSEEVGCDVGLNQYHITLECSLDSRAIWECGHISDWSTTNDGNKNSILFCLMVTCVVTDNVLECFANVNSEIVI